MKKFEAPDAKTEVAGSSLLAFVKNSNSDELQPILMRAGLHEIDPQGWYPMQNWLTVFRTIAEEHNGNSMFDFVSIGIALAHTMPLPPQINTFQAAITALPQGYNMSHRNGYPGEFVIEHEDNLIRIIKRTPYPDELTYGLLWGLVRRYAPKPGDVRVVNLDPFREQWRDQAVFEVSW